MSAFQETPRSSCYSTTCCSGPHSKEINSETPHWYHASGCSDFLLKTFFSSQKTHHLMVISWLSTRLLSDYPMRQHSEKTGYALCCYSSVVKSYFGKYTRNSREKLCLNVPEFGNRFYFLHLGTATRTWILFDWPESWTFKDVAGHLRTCPCLRHSGQPLPVAERLRHLYEGEERNAPKRSIEEPCLLSSSIVTSRRSRPFSAKTATGVYRLQPDEALTWRTMTPSLTLYSGCGYNVAFQQVYSTLIPGSRHIP